MAGLQDFLLYQAVEQQNQTKNPLFALAEGVSRGIEEGRQRMKEKKQEEEDLALQLKFDQMQNTNSGKLGDSISATISKRTVTRTADGKRRVVLTRVENPQIKLEQEERRQRTQDMAVVQQSFGNSTKLREEFIQRPEVKDYINVSTNVNAMDALLKKALSEPNEKNNVAVDQGIITMYNKLTDPQSVVRESEYARTPENLPLVNKITGAIQKVQAGGAGLTNEDRIALVEGAKIILKERGKTYNSAINRYNSLADQYSLDKSLITEEFKPYSPENFGGSVNVAIDGVGVTSKGTKYKRVQ
jgi:hypothetical protein